MVERGDILENVHVTGFSNEGKSVGRVDNFVLFIEDAVPGDVVDVKIFKKKKNFAEGRAVRLVEPSIKRTDPFCQHFGICGGCKWQHLSYESQLAFKQEQVKEAFERIGKVSIPEILPIKGSADIRHYRNKLEFTFSNKVWLTREEMGIATDEIPALGFHVTQRFDKILDIKTCYLMDEVNNDIRLSVKNFCISNGISFFDLKEQKGEMRNLIIRNTSTGEWMVVVCFHTFDDKRHSELMNHLKEKFPFVNSLQYVVNPKRNDTIFDLEVKLFHGRDYIIEEMEGLKFRISAKSFYQTNSYQAYELYKIAREFASFKGDEIVYDLYTGTGTIASFISQKVRHVYGIEFIDDAITDARKNADTNNLQNLTFFTGDIKKTLNDEFINKYGKPDVIITDPPRAGMHVDVINSIMKALPEKVIYVSCNPQTQARDINLMDQYYRVDKIQPVDMFPHTSHVENVVLLIRRDEKI
jgi:23S rRNA (uracil1939-C5)-methyltransferase